MLFLNDEFGHCKGKKSLNNIIINGTMSVDEVAASYVPPRYLIWVCVSVFVSVFVFRSHLWVSWWAYHSNQRICSLCLLGARVSCLDWPTNQWGKFPLGINSSKNLHPLVFLLSGPSQEYLLRCIIAFLHPVSPDVCKSFDMQEPDYMRVNLLTTIDKSQNAICEIQLHALTEHISWISLTAALG